MQSSIEKAFDAVRAGEALSLEELLTLEPSLAAARNESGLSLVLQACYFRRLDMVEMILAADPTLDIFDIAALPTESRRGAPLLAADPAVAASWSSDGFTPLHLASYFNHEEMARLLLECGADADAVSRNPMSLRPLHSACASGAQGVVVLLLERGVDVNARQHGGWTALHSAVNRGDLRLVELLLERGARPDVANDDGKTSFELADQRELADVSKLLREARMNV
jgi:uncharacterized protein